MGVNHSSVGHGLQLIVLYKRKYTKSLALHMILALKKRIRSEMSLLPSQQLSIVLNTSGIHLFCFVSFQSQKLASVKYKYTFSSLKVIFMTILINTSTLSNII